MPVCIVAIAMVWVRGVSGNDVVSMPAMVLVRGECLFLRASANVLMILVWLSGTWQRSLLLGNLLLSRVLVLLMCMRMMVDLQLVVLLLMRAEMHVLGAPLCARKWLAVMTVWVVLLSAWRHRLRAATVLSFVSVQCRLGWCGVVCWWGRCQLS